MQIYSIVLLKSDPEPRVVSVAYDLSSIGYFQRSTVKEFIIFFTTTISSRINQGERKSIVDQDNYIHLYKNASGYTCAVVCDSEYPSRIAFTLINKILDEPIANLNLEKFIVEYKDPSKIDNISKIQQDLNETKLIMNQTIEAILARGEALDDLVKKSNNLSENSKLFYKDTKKMNSCCVIL